jgi:hypothetical protein
MEGELVVGVDAVNRPGCDGSVSFGPSLEVGQIVCVTAGPFTHLLSELKRLDDQGRVRVLLEISSVLLEIICARISVSLPEAFVASA